MHETIQKKKAVLYCRVSTKEQVEEGNSLVTQERICKEYAYNNGFEIAEIYLEQGESAKTADRTELNKLLAYCSLKRNDVKAVIIYKLDRLSRNTDDYSKLRLLLKRYGVEIKSTSEHFENTPVGRFMENTLANISQFDNDIRTERSTNGMKEAVREGRYVWKAPIGYDNVRIGGKSTIIQNKELAPLVLRAFQLVAGNICSVQEAYRIVSSEGLKRNGKPIVGAYFRWMLNNRLYAGWIESFGQVHKGLFEPIVSDDLFAQVQRVLKYRGKLHSPHVRDNPDFPLRRFIVNENGRRLTGSWAKGRRQKYPYYRFLPSGGFNYNRDKFDEAFMQFMDSYGLAKETYEKLERFVTQELTHREQAGKREAEKIRLHIHELNQRQSILIKKNIDGVINDALLKQQLETIDVELTKAYAISYRDAETNVNLEDVIAYLEPYLTGPSSIWINALPHTRIALQRFQFPLGCAFIKGSFETAQIRSLFKVKSAFSNVDSNRVHPTSKIRNNSEGQKPIESTGDNSSQEDASKPVFDEAFWDEFRRDAHEVYTILKDDKESPP